MSLETTQISRLRLIYKDMAHIVDDKDNIKHFIETMSNFASRFANGRYEPSRMTTFDGPATSIAQAANAEPTNVDVLCNAGLSKTLTFQRSHLPREEHNDVKLSSTKETASADLHKAEHRMQNEGPPVDHQLSSSNFFGAANKQLQSPQLSGLRAPPPTPETLARKGHTNSDDVEDLVGPEVGKILAGNGRPVGLEGSRYASHQPSPLNKQQAQVEVSGKFNAGQVLSIKTGNDLAELSLFRRGASLQQPLLVADPETSPGLKTAIEFASSKALLSHDKPRTESRDTKERLASHVNAKQSRKETSAETFAKNGGTYSSPDRKWHVESATTEVVDPWHTPNSELPDSFDEPKLGRKTTTAFKSDPFTQPEAKATFSRPSQKVAMSSTAGNKTTAANLNSRLFVEDMQAKIMAFQASRGYKPSAPMGQPVKTSSEVTVVPSKQSLTPRPHVPPALSYSQAELLALRPKNLHKGIVKDIPTDLRVAAEKSTVGGRPTSKDEGKLIDFDNAISPPHLRLPAGLKNENPSSYKNAATEAPKRSPEAGISTTPLRPQPARAPLALKSVKEREDLPLQNLNINPRPTPSSESPGFVASSTMKDRLEAGAKISTYAAAASGQGEDLFLGKNWRKPEKRDSAGKCSQYPES